MNYYAQQIKESVSIRDVCDMYGIEINRAGFARCPFHAEKTASFKVFKDGCKCFGCGVYAQNAIDFVMLLFGLSFQNACEKINNDFGLGLTMGRAPTLREVREAEQRYKELKAQHEAETARREALKSAYHKAYDEWARLDKQRMKNLPKTPDEINDKYAEAVKRLPMAAYALDIAEMELYNYDH